jgi:pimeloyl-ACP methyl ester carboxylesterase
MRTLHTLLILALAAAAAPPAAAQTPEIVDVRTVAVGSFVRTDSTVLAGPAAIDRFVMHRLVHAAAPRPPRRVLLLLGPLSNGFEFFETDERGLYDLSFAAFFARLGFEVWGYSPRGLEIAAGSCESGAVDCSPMDGWGIGSMVDDVAFIRDAIEQAHPGSRPVLVGYSLGGGVAIATLNALPDRWEAAAILEGAIYNEDPVVAALNAGYCQDAGDQLAAGEIYDGGSLPLLQFLAALAEADPDGLTPFGGFPPGTTNHQVWVFALAVPQIGPFWQTPGFVRCAGSVEQDRFYFCDDRRVYAHTRLFGAYFTTRVIRDLTCSLAGEPTFTANLAAFDAPVYLMGGGQSFAAQNRDLAGILGSTDVTLLEEPEFGHADHWFTARHRRYVELPLLHWLNALP